MNKTVDNSYMLKLVVRNNPGVLVRCAQIFGRRGHNIESLHVAALEADPGRSQMTISAFGEPKMREQITNQLEKLVDVIEVEEVIS